MKRTHKLLFICLLLLLYTASCSGYRQVFSSPKILPSVYPWSSTLKTFTSLTPTPSPSSQPTITSTLAPDMIPTVAPNTENVITSSELAVALSVYPSTGSSVVRIGDRIEIVLESDPMMRSMIHRSDGSLSATHELPWDDHPITEMSMCTSVNTPCELGNQWIPFVVSPLAHFVGGSQVKFELLVDWIGLRTVWVNVQFHDAHQNIIPAYGSRDQVSQLVGQVGIDVEGVWDEATPLAEMPVSVQTGVGATRTALAATLEAFPIMGWVDIGPGLGTIGGLAGETIQTRVVFSATSPFGEVTEMRITGGCQSVRIEEVPWEPFVISKTFPIHVAINWTTFSLSVQYRDSKGNMSLVYCDEVAVEGSHPTPTPIPTPVWYAQVQCLSINEVHPGPGETVRGEVITLSWPDKNQLPKGISYRVSIFALQPYRDEIATGITKETSLTLKVPSGYSGEFIWIVILIDEARNWVNHGQCSRIPANLFTVVDSNEIPGVHFWYQP